MIENLRFAGTLFSILALWLALSTLIINYISKKLNVNIVSMTINRSNAIITIIISIIILYLCNK